MEEWEVCLIWSQLFNNSFVMSSSEFLHFFIPKTRSSAANHFAPRGAQGSVRLSCTPDEPCIPLRGDTTHIMSAGYPEYQLCILVVGKKGLP